MSAPSQTPAVPATAAQAVAMVNAGLSWLATADATTLTSAEKADCLRALEQAKSRHTAAQSKVMAAFDATDAHQDDGHPTTRSWLRWQTRLTRSAAAAAVGWMRRLAAHPAVAGALADGVVSESWARDICAWTDLLREAVRRDADVVLLAAAAGGAELEDLGKLAEEIRSRTATPDADGKNHGFGDRHLRLSTTLDGAGVLRGELTAQCAAALQVLLDALGKRRGPEDTRTRGQRDHDSLEEICRRLIAAGGLPDRAGQSTQIMLHMTLGQLRGMPGADTAEAAWAGAVAGPGYDCDATIVPVVSGHVDPDVLDQLTRDLLDGRDGRDTSHGDPSQDTSHGDTRQDQEISADTCPDQHDDRAEDTSHCQAPDSQAEADSRGYPGGSDPAAARCRRTERTVQQILVRNAADLLSGPGGLAAVLRNGISDRVVASVSLPLDVGAAVEIIPAHLRRAVIARDRHCRFPGCDQPVAACQPHHIIPRSQGGPTSLTNMILLCSFHHLVAVHRWGWGVVLWPDGTVTATSPDKTRIHGPPRLAA